MHDIKEETRNRWPGILAALGIDVGVSGKHCACPVCKAGKDRFRFDNKDGQGTWICNQCGAGDGFGLVMEVLNIEFKEAVKEIKKIIGSADITKPQPEAKISRELLRKIYTESKPIVEGDPAWKYLTHRGLSVISEKLRYHPACYEPETQTKMPAMLATYSLPDGTAITMHRTFITQDGKKANVKNPKKIMPALKKMTGGAVRLFEPVNGVIAVAEGIETALTVYQMTKIPIWSVVSSTLMEKFEPPSGIKTVMIFGDHDKNFTGQKAAYTLANKLTVQNKLGAEVYIPKNTGDYLNELTQKW